ncbi:histidine kinase [Joostella atrarenae]|uniref:Histidine kinase n=1 Tax=Joostella atrarenae TaxID=679257 RepID=A0ABS9J568_9FLAO|nr:histidine kinase [Joostella atrarenae]MCF8715571.1 histidine kinase [Joostella atrarenae]
MNRIFRTISQIVFWAIVWVAIGSTQGHSLNFYTENSLAFAFQTLLIIAVNYLLAPKLIIKKKYFVFIAISLGLIITLSFFSSEFIRSINPPEMNMPERPFPPNRSPRKPIPSAFFIHVLFLSISLIIATIIEILIENKKKEEALIISKTETLETELKLLRSQINPHFLFNSLNNIYALSAVDTQKTQESIIHLSDMLRYVLYECERPLVSINKEVTYINNFIKLFLLKSSKNYPITTNINVENNNLLIAPMLLIPFVENAFKHSNIENIKESFIKITLETTNNKITFKITNSKSKISTQKDGVGGIGIKNVKKRLSILYPEKHALHISDDDNTFTVTLNLINDV